MIINVTGAIIICCVIVVDGEWENLCHEIAQLEKSGEVDLLAGLNGIKEGMSAWPRLVLERR